MSDLDRYLDDFGRTLERATAGPARASAPRRRRRVVAAGGLATALAGALVAVFALPGAQEQLDPVDQARAALATQGQIVHTVVTQELRRHDRRGRRVPARPADESRVEQWTTPSRWRILSTSAVHRPFEVAQEGTTQRYYDRARNRLTIMRGVRAPEVTSPAPYAGAIGEDPVVRLRALLDDGQLRDAGTTTAGGREVRRLTGQHRFRTSRGTVAIDIEYDVDPATSAPIEVRISSKAAGTSARAVSVTTFEVYERLEPTAENARLLTIDPKPNPKVVVERLQR